MSAQKSNPLSNTAFDGIQLDSDEVLRGLKRQQCPKCDARKMYFCQQCRIPVHDGAPRVDLPIPADIIMHQNERVGKATGIHTCILAPGQVRLFLFPEKETEFGPIPDYTEEDEALLLYPSEDSVPIDELDLRHVKRVVFVDSTWQQSRAILRDPRLAKLKRVRINEVRTRFWRHQTYGPAYLATIEAIHTFYKEFVTAQLGGKYDHSVDNLLWYYKYMHDMIQDKYKKSNKTFSKAMLRDSERGQYILYDDDEDAPEVKPVPVDDLPKMMRKRVQKYREEHGITEGDDEARAGTDGDMSNGGSPSQGPGASVGQAQNAMAAMTMSPAKEK